MSTCGTISISTGLAAYCTDCDHEAVASLDVMPMDLVPFCKVCHLAMTGFLAYGQEILTHGTSCPACVSSAPRPTRSFDDVELTANQFHKLHPLAYGGDVVVAVDAGGSLDEAITELVLTSIQEAS